MENAMVNMIGDCVEAVYHEVCEKRTDFPLRRMKEVIDGKSKPSEYEIVKNIAKGGYGEVLLVRKEKVYAMKRVSKELVLKQPHTALFMSEKEAMIGCIGSEWLVCAHMTMQDEEYLYYLMDFVPGGDFMGLLSKEDVLEEEWVRFYAAEIVSALDELHKLGWIHRDLKPDNILIGADGHVKLADLGSCIKMIDGKARSSITVGTPDYVSPDVLCSMNEECEYGEDVDFWTLGVIIYEMVYGATPFYSETLMETYRRISKVEFDYPFKVSGCLTDLIGKLIATKKNRIGIEEIKAHPFFSGIDWTKLKDMKPPFVPEINGDIDTSHFVDTQFDAEKRNPDKKGSYMPFIGFTFDPTFASKISSMIGNGSSGGSCSGLSDGLNVRMNEGESEKMNEELSMKIDENRKVMGLQNQELMNSKTELEEVRLRLKESSDDMKRHEEELKNVLTQLLVEKEELEESKVELEKYKRYLKDMTDDINDRRVLSEEYSLAQKKSHGSYGMIGCDKMIECELSCIKKEIQDIMKDVGSVQEIMNELSMENKGLQSEVKMYKERYCEILGVKTTIESENKVLEEKLKMEGLDNLKRQLRLRTAEVKEYEQKLNQEILFRKSIEEELNFMRKEKPKTQRVISKQSFQCHIVGGESTTIKVEDEYFWIGGENQHINNVYVGGLKPNELHHLPQKKISLTLRIVFMSEEVKSVSSSGRRSLKSLEEDLRTELAIKEGIENIRTLLDGKTLEEANMQLEGSNRKINQLMAEIERSRKSTMVESIPDDPVKIYEFNNHLFTNKTVPQGTFCDFCNEVLYGLVDQGFECRDCGMVVHKSCYVLGDVSCELYAAMKTGKTHYVTMRTIEERDRLLSVNGG